LCGACHGKGGPSDEDLLDKFVKDVSGPVDAALVERSIGYTQLADLPIDVRVPQLSGVYDSSKSDELLSSYRNGMRGHFYGTEIDVRSKTIAIHDAHADVKLALMTAVGPLHADIGLQKLASGWKVERVHIDR
jgi:hypothetical protein